MATNPDSALAILMTRPFVPTRGPVALVSLRTAHVVENRARWRRRLLPRLRLRLA